MRALGVVGRCAANSRARRRWSPCEGFSRLRAEPCMRSNIASLERRVVGSRQRAATKWGFRRRIENSVIRGGLRPMASSATTAPAASRDRPQGVSGVYARRRKAFQLEAAASVPRLPEHRHRTRPIHDAALRSTSTRRTRRKRETGPAWSRAPRAPGGHRDRVRQLVVPSPRSGFCAAARCARSNGLIAPGRTSG